MLPLKITECPRDAMQGLSYFIETEDKIRYINSLLKVGFNCIDVGSFVNPRVIPNLRDTSEVLERVEKPETTQLLAIVGNQRGAEQACSHTQIDFIGFPFSVSETFLARNINSNFEDAIQKIADFQEITSKYGKSLLVYLSMGFGNPYGDEWNPEIVAYWTDRLAHMGVNYVALSDTIGEATPEVIHQLFTSLLPEFPQVEIGAHFHTTPSNWMSNVDAAYKAGCQKFDTAMMGFGGCPMAKDSLTGNLPTENLVLYCAENNIPLNIRQEAFFDAAKIASEIFRQEKHLH